MEVYAQIDAKVLGLRLDEEAQRPKPEAVALLSSHLLTIDQLRDALLEIDALHQAPAGKIAHPVRLDLAPLWPSRGWIFRGISAIAQRLIWPVLPQKNRQSGMETYLQTLRACPVGLMNFPSGAAPPMRFIPQKPSNS